MKTDGTKEETTNKKFIYELQIEFEKWKLVHADWDKTTRIWKENKSKVYHLILCQCPPELIEHLKSIGIWEKTSSDLDVVNLLVMVRAVCLKLDETKQGVMSAVNSDIRLYTFRKGKEMPCEYYLKLFRA